jgi:hypothetical protein
MSKFAGHFVELKSGMSYRLWEQVGDEPTAESVELWETPRNEADEIDELKRKIEELTKQHDRYEILRKLNPQQFAALNERCRTQDLRFDDEVLRLARVWQEEKRIDL